MRCAASSIRTLLSELDVGFFSIDALGAYDTADLLALVEDYNARLEENECAAHACITQFSKSCVGRGQT